MSRVEQALRRAGQATTLAPAHPRPDVLAAAADTLSLDLYPGELRAPVAAVLVAGGAGPSPNQKLPLAGGFFCGKVSPPVSGAVQKKGGPRPHASPGPPRKACAACGA